MLRAVAVLFLLQNFQKASSQDDGGASINLGQHFYTEADTNCTIGGELVNKDGCYECYICGGKSSKEQENRKKTISYVQLFDDKCKPTQYCCYSQQDSVARTSRTDCGTINPSGVPRSTRNSLKSVLPGEYPWRTWIFRKLDQALICAGIYFDISSRAILTSAKCVYGYMDDNLSVGFSRRNGNLNVKELIVHNDYNPGSRYNDIAIVLLSSSNSLPGWAKVACLPTLPAQIDTSCVAISNDDKYVNTLIPFQKRCFDEQQSNEALLCSLSAKGDNEPEFSGGLFCEKETATNKIGFVLFGIYLYKDQDVSVYTNVSNYNDWIYNCIQSNI